jgi:hypothetical protein
MGYAELHALLPNLPFELDKRGFKRHTVSVVHRKAKLIRAMLERNCITHAEIARRVG